MPLAQPPPLCKPTKGNWRAPHRNQKCAQLKVAFWRSGLRPGSKRGRLWKDRVGRGAARGASARGRYVKCATAGAAHGNQAEPPKERKIYFPYDGSKRRNDPVNGKIGCELGGGLRSLSFSPLVWTTPRGEKERLRRPAEINSSVRHTPRPGWPAASQTPSPFFHLMHCIVWDPGHALCCLLLFTQRLGLLVPAWPTAEGGGGGRKNTRKMLFFGSGRPDPQARGGTMVCPKTPSTRPGVPFGAVVCPPPPSAAGRPGGGGGAGVWEGGGFWVNQK